MESLIMLYYAEYLQSLCEFDVQFANFLFVQI